MAPHYPSKYFLLVLQCVRNEYRTDQLVCTAWALLTVFLPTGSPVGFPGTWALLAQPACALLSAQSSGKQLFS